MATPDPMDELPAIIGEICIMWSHIENQLRDICVSHALNTAPESAKDHLSTVLSVWAENVNEKQLISIAYATLFRTLDADDFKIAKTTINHVDTTLREKRNRYVHDLWIAYPDRFEKTRFKTGVTKNNSDLIYQSANKTIFSDISEIRKTLHDIIIYHDRLGEYVISSSLS